MPRRSRMRAGFPRGQSGHAVADVLVTFAVVLALLAAVVPSVAAAILTYKRNGAARRVLAEIRAAQSQAVTRGAVVGLQWGADPLVNRPASQFRVVRDASGSCALPSPTAPQDGTDVIESWRDLGDDFPDASILSIRDAANQDLSAVMFNSFGASVNTCAGISFPVTVTVTDGSGSSKTIEIRGAGGTRLL